MEIADGGPDFHTAAMRERRTRPTVSPSQNWRTLFIEHLTETSNVAESARHAGIVSGEAYRTRRIEPEFASQWLAALADGYAHLEMELLRRLRHGNFKTTDSERYDIANAIRLLAGRRDNGPAGHGRAPDVTAADVRASIDRKIADIRSRISEDQPDGTPVS